ncbi:hypothetical protein [Thermoanaerobacter siderophilus]|uniref:Uncharacterized protein n=1 Tax=Thermoanaerobacter siderophilus SR4 TaxID=880478 RepID=I9AFP5_9THEO|nr:hypothetical protein [Thermoanaerobacter siderophilus]EIW00842.1 hypothetical protein ThesiDRAFT1_1968 [Thermoanaerobacter siderophilus SR4]
MIIWPQEDAAKKNRSIIYTLIIVFLLSVLIGSAAFAYKYMFEDRYVQVNSTTKIWDTPSDEEKSSSPLQQQPNTTKNQEKIILNKLLQTKIL